MRILNTLKRLVTRAPSVAEVHAAAEKVEKDAKPWGLRRWESAKTNRINEGQWNGAYDQSINQDLAHDLETLRARCHWEIENNNDVKGVVETYVVDLVGKNGPDLQLQSSNAEYNETAEKLYRKWWMGKPSLDGQSGPDALKVWVRSLWPEGEYLLQLVTDPAFTADGISLRLNTIAARRLGANMVGTEPNVILGVEVDKYLRPLRYYIGNEWNAGGSGTLNLAASTSATPVNAENIIHQFIHEEPGQIRGVPWLASALQVIANLRDYDTEVLAAATNCARMFGVFQCSDPHGERWVPLPAGQSMSFKRDAIMAAPPGWDFHSPNASQPAANYVDFRRENQRALGRSVSMPLMIIRLDSSNHNYSSARFDDQTYKGALDSFRGDLERGTMGPIADAFLREATLAGLLGPRPDDLEKIWTWPARPEVDSAKEAEGQTLRMENLTLPFAMACQRYGLTEDQVIASWKRTNEKLKAAGLPLLQQPDSKTLENTKARAAKEAQEANAKEKKNAE